MTPTSADTRLAIDGGAPVRETLLPYGRQTIEDDDVAAVVEALRSDWLTTGPGVDEFELAFAEVVSAEHAVSFSSGTAALHAAVFAAELGPGDDAIVTPLTFCGTANALLFQGARPVFADISGDTLNLDPTAVEAALTPATKAIVAVDYAGHPADLDALLALAERKSLVVIEDACHALGAELGGRRIGSLSHLTAFSFHPVKHITTAEGGMVTTNDAALARRLRLFRNHGIDSDARERQNTGRWYYEMVELGFNYRLPDLTCALGRSQLGRLADNLARRRAIAVAYEERLSAVEGLMLPAVRAGVAPAWHLYPVRVVPTALGTDRDAIFDALRAEGIGVNVHYIPVHLHPYYRKRF